MSASNDTDDTDDAPTLADLNNAEAAADVGSDHIEERNLTQEAQNDLTQTRQNLETPHAEDGSETPHEGREEHVSGDSVTTDGGPEIIATDAEPFRMTDERRVSTVSIHIGEDEVVAFGKPSAYAGREIKSTLQGQTVEVDVDNPEEASQEEIEAAAQQDDWLVDWLALTLAEWSLDDDRDPEWWVKNKATSDMIEVLRGLMHGGNLQGR